ncbi:MAG: PAS domain-containing sensor histidine kinase [Campylobacterales bacterium]
MMSKSFLYLVSVVIWVVVSSLVYSLFDERLNEQYSNLENRVDTLLLTAKKIALLDSRVMFYENFDSYEYAKLLKKVSTSSSKSDLDSAKELLQNLAGPAIFSQINNIVTASFYSSEGMFIDSVSKRSESLRLPSGYFSSIDDEFEFFLQDDKMFSLLKKIYFQGSLVGYIVLSSPAIASLSQVFVQEGFNVSIVNNTPTKQIGCKFKETNFVCYKPSISQMSNSYYVIEGSNKEFQNTQDNLFFWLVIISAFFALLLFFIYKTQKASLTKKKLNETLSKQNRFLQTVIDAIPNPVFVKDSKLRYVMVNRAVVDFFGRNSKYEMLGKSDKELIADKKISEHFYSQDSSVLKEKKTLYIENEELLAGSEQLQKWYQTTKVPLIGIGYPKKEDMLLGIATDITKLENLKRELAEINEHLNIKITKELEERLKSQKRYKELFENIGEAIIAIKVEDESYKIDEVNLSALRLFSRDREDIIDCDLDKIISFDDIRETLDEIVSKGKLELKTEVLINKKAIFAELKARVYLHNCAKTILLSIRDITEHERLKKENREHERLIAQQAKMAEMGDMIGAIAHQWRQPLNSINAAAVKLKMHSALGSLTPKSVDEVTSFIEEQSDKMSDTISDFLNFFKPSKAKERFFLKEVVENIKKMLGVQLESRNIEFECDIDDIEIYGYKNELEHIILNLVINARDAFEGKSSKNNWIKIDGKSDDSRVVISVEDSAGGIPQNILDKIFNPYFTTKPTNKGTGIGLYMVKNILEKGFKGDIRVSNTEYGAKFIMEF